MLGTSLIGQTLSWCPIPDPIDAWGFFLDDNPVAEVHRPSSRGVVRIETGTEVLRIHFHGVSILRAVLQAQTDEPLLLFAGSFRRGRARLYEGSEFVFFSKIDRKNGPWVGFDDLEGAGVLRVRGRSSRGEIWSEITTTPDGAHSRSVGPLILLWGALYLLRLRRPWLSLSTLAVSDRSTRRSLALLSSGMAS
jgi:hypothetical protein